MALHDPERNSKEDESYVCVLSMRENACNSLQELQPFVTVEDINVNLDDDNGRHAERTTEASGEVNTTTLFATESIPICEENVRFEEDTENEIDIMSKPVINQLTAPDEYVDPSESEQNDMNAKLEAEKEGDSTEQAAFLSGGDMYAEELAKVTAYSSGPVPEANDSTERTAFLPPGDMYAEELAKVTAYTSGPIPEADPQNNDDSLHEVEDTKLETDQDDDSAEQTTVLPPEDMHANEYGNHGNVDFSLEERIMSALDEGTTKELKNMPAPDSIILETNQESPPEATDGPVTPLEGNTKECLAHNTDTPTTEILQPECRQPGLIYLRRKPMGVEATFPVTKNERRKCPQPVPGFITLTKEKCCFSFDEDPNIFRVNMPCGHTFAAEAVACIVKNTLTSCTGNIDLRCPVPNKNGMICGYEWDYNILRQAGCFTEDENQEYERKLGELYLLRVTKAKQCPNCRSFCMRANNMSSRVQCAICHAADFCWSCLRSWKSSKNSGWCGNEDCSTDDDRLRCLRKSSMSTLGYSNVESYTIRACPSCGHIMEHVGGCKQVMCIACKTSFCFICLQLYDKENHKWPCGSYNTKCTKAGIQTDLKYKK